MQRLLLLFRRLLLKLKIIFTLDQVAKLITQQIDVYFLRDTV